MEKHNRTRRILAFILSLIVMLCSMSLFTVEAKAETYTCWIIYNYNLGVNADGTINVTITSKLSDSHYDENATYFAHFDNCSFYYYLNTTYTDNPHTTSQYRLGTLTWTSNEYSTHTTYATISREQFNTAFSDTAVQDIYTYITDSYVRFYGYNVYHYAYFFANGASYEPNRFGSIDSIAGGDGLGRAYKYNVKDPSTAYYRIYDSDTNTWGSWTAVSGVLKKDFYRSDYKSGDKVQYKTISALGFESNVAEYTFPTYTLTLNANSGSVTTSSYTMSYGKTNNSTVNIPTRTGYTFEGWYTSSTGGTQVYDATGKATNEGTYFSLGKWNKLSNVTLYAQWTPSEYTLTINPNGGAMYNGDNETMYNFTTKFIYNRSTYLGNLNSDETFWADNKPTRTGYTFNGFTFSRGTGGINSSGYKFYFSNTSYSSTDTLSYIFDGNHAGNVIATAQWKANTYYVSYSKGSTNNGGTTSKTTHTYDADVTLASNGFTGRSYSLAFSGNKPKDDYGNVTAGTVTNLQSTKSGKLSFKNWYITNANNNNNTYASANTNLGKKNYRTDNGGTASATAQWNSVTLDSFKEPSLTGYKFNGYYTASSGGTKTTSVNVSPATTAYSNTLYAQWTPITYKVRFNGNGNWNTSQGSYTQTLTYDKHTALTDNKFTRADATTYNSVYYERGYEFIGWGESSTQKTPTYTNKQTVCNLTATDGKVIDLYALWKKEITLTINFNGGKFNNNGTSKVLSYTMYNSELNHTFDITQYYGTLTGTGYNSKGLNTNLTKTDSNGIQYRFLGYSLNQNATVPDTQFDVYSSSRTENYTIKDNTTIYAVWEPVLQMTAQITAPTHTLEIQLDRDVPITTAIGNFTILNGTKSTDLPSNATASANTATIGATVINKDSITYTVSAKGTSNIKFTTAADSRIIDIYNNGKNDTWFDELNTVSDFNYTVSDFSSVTGSFTIPQYLGTTRSYQTSNPNSSTNTTVYGLKFTCSQESYYYRKYWNTTESTSVYCILFLDADNPSGGNNPDGTPILPPSAVKDGYYEFETILN